MDGQHYVLKLGSSELSSEMIELEHLAVEHLIKAGSPVNLPRVVPTKTGAIKIDYPDGDLHL